LVPQRCVEDPQHAVQVRDHDPDPVLGDELSQGEQGIGVRRVVGGHPLIVGAGCGVGADHDGAAAVGPTPQELPVLSPERPRRLARTCASCDETGRMTPDRVPFTPLEERIDRWAQRRTSTLATAGGMRRARLVELVVFGLKQAWACVFGAVMLVLLVTARVLYPDDAPLARADALVLAAVAVQVAMLALRLESLREMGVIALFHLVGTAMEVFKTAVGSWAYETDGLLRIGEVPLYTGFMYAAVGSYMVRVMRLFDLRFTRYPPLLATAALAAAIYANFFTHHYLPDARWVLL